MIDVWQSFKYNTVMDLIFKFPKIHVNTTALASTPAIFIE